MEEIDYRNWSVNPKAVDNLGSVVVPLSMLPIWTKMKTKHEGSVYYRKYWNFWIRADAKADMRSGIFFRDYEYKSAEIGKLLNDVLGLSQYMARISSEEDIWLYIGKIWDWLKNNVQYNVSEYATMSSDPDEWPSILDFANYYASHNNGSLFRDHHLGVNGS